MIDQPVKRSLNRDFSHTADSRTGGGSKYEQREVNSPIKGAAKVAEMDGSDLREKLEQKRERDLRAELKQRQDTGRGGSPRREARHAGSHLESRHHAESTGDGRRHAGTYREEPHHADRAAEEKRRASSYHYDPRHDRAGRRDSYGDVKPGQSGRTKGRYVRRPRSQGEKERGPHQVYQEKESGKKRPPKQIWVAKGDRSEFLTCFCSWRFVHITSMSSSSTMRITSCSKKTHVYHHKYVTKIRNLSSGI